MWRLANSLDGRLMLIWAVMVTVFGSADASPSVTTAALAQSVTTASPAPSGARFIVTQGLLDRLRDAFLPVALEFIRNYPIPSVHTDKDSFSITADSVKLSNLNADASIMLNAPSAVDLQLTNLKLSVSGHVKVREDVWPHPSVSGSLSADSHGSATVTLAVEISNGVAKLVLDRCHADISVEHIKFHGLSILDPILDWVAGFFKGTIKEEISKAVCTYGVTQTLVPDINAALHALTYVTPLSFLPPPFDQSALDWHLTDARVVVNSTSANGFVNSTSANGFINTTTAATSFLAIGLHAEVLTAGGTRDPNATLPTMSDPSQRELRMATSELSPFPLNTALWTYYSQGALTYTVASSVLPPSYQWLLNTRGYKTLMPKLYAAFPDHNMSLVVSTLTCPIITIADGALTLRGLLDLAFKVHENETAFVDAFDLQDRTFEASITLEARSGPPPAVGGTIAKVHIALSPGAAHFGALVPDLLALLSKPLDAILNDVLLPLANTALSKGVAIPTLQTTIGGYQLVVNLTRPEIDMSGRTFALVGTDAAVHIVPPSAHAKP